MKSHLAFLFVLLFFNSTNFYGQLNGVYTIGNSGDYKSLKSAVDDLGAVGMNGPVTFNYLNGAIDTVPVTFPNAITGLSFKDSLLIQSSPGGSKRAYLENRNRINQQSFMIDCILKHVTFNNLEIFTDSAYGSLNRAMILGNGKLINSTINSPYSHQPVLIVSSNATVMDCRIEGNNGTGILVSSSSIQVLIKNNIIKNYFVVGLYMSNGKHNTITRNQFIGGEKSSSAITLLFADSVSITKNTILEYADPQLVTSLYSTGIILRFSDRCLVQNNMVSSEGIAYRQYSGSDNRIEHNAFYTTIDSSNQPTILLTSIAGHGDNYFRNNICMSEGSKLILLQVDAGAPDYFKSMDYNDWFSSQPSPLFNYESSSPQKFNSLSAWSNATQRDDKSLETNPGFTSKSDLHISSVQLFNNGLFLPYITDDFDSEVRIPQHPGIGADQIIYDHVENGDGLSGILVYPNPGHSRIWLDLNSYTGAVDFSMTDMLGHFVLKKSMNFEGSVKEVNISNLPSGVYILNIHEIGRSHYSTFIKC